MDCSRVNVRRGATACPEASARSPGGRSSAYAFRAAEPMGPRFSGAYGATRNHADAPASTAGAVIVFLTDRSNKLMYFDGSVKTFQNHAGDVIWSAPTTHKSENLTGAQFAAIQIEPKPVANAKPFPTESTDAVTVDPQHYHVIVENEWIRAIALTVGPHEKLKMHKHPATGAVVVYLSDQDMRQYHADGSTHESHFKAGVVRWVPPDAAHQDENLSDKPFRLVRIELKEAQ